MLHLAHTTTGPVSYTTEPPAPEDTFCDAEYAALCEVVAATHLPGAPLLPTVQAAVTGAWFTRGERWLKEGCRLLQKHGLLPAETDAPMVVCR